MTIEHFTKANEGTYTIQIHDGKAKSQSSLVLVGDGKSLTVSKSKSPVTMLLWDKYRTIKTVSKCSFLILAFKVALKEAEFQRKEHIRKQGL